MPSLANLATKLAVKIPLESIRETGNVRFEYEPESIKELAEKDFVVRLNDDDVVYVKDFFEQNTLRADRVKASRYHDLLADVCPQNAADCQPNIIQSNLITIIKQ